jgi:dipeptidase E
MKNLFLASVARNTLDILVKSLDSLPGEFTVAFIPTAGNIMKENWFVLEDRKKLIDLGFKVIDLNLEGKTKNQLLEEMNGVDIVFVAGGNTFYLLQETRKSGFDEIVTSFVGKGGIYVGSSAGTLLAGPSIELAKDIDNQNEAVELSSFDGLALVDFVVLPHYDDKEFKDKIDQNLQKHKPYKYKVITISDNQAVVVKGNDFEVVTN